jgi:acetylglutamate kinase
MTKRPWVVKIGGKLGEKAGTPVMLARACAALPEPLVLVHGGGSAVTRLQVALGLQPRFAAGRRMTTAEDMAAVEMVLSGSANKTLVRALVGAGLRAVGVSGCDGALMRCARLPGLGEVGTPAAVEPQLLHALLGAGFTPVVSPVSLGPEGGVVNVNADEAACALATALGAARLLLLSDVPGVKVAGAWRADLDVGEVEALIAGGEVEGGMIPKLRAAASAVAAGVGEVRIAGYAGQRLDQVQGTRVAALAAGGHVHAR